MTERLAQKPKTKNPLTRRGFFTSLIRLAIGTGLLATGGMLLSRRQPVDGPFQPANGCTEGLPCSRCGKSGYCSLPQAVSYRVGRPGEDRQRETKKPNALKTENR